MDRYYNDFNDIRGSDDELMHYGVQGMKWGIRKYVNYDGSLTAEGRRKYGSYQNFAKSSEGRKMLSEAKNQNGVKTRQSSQEPKKQYTPYAPHANLSTKDSVKIGALTLAGTLMTIGGYKLGDALADKVLFR